MRERERCERLMAEVLKTTADLMAVQEAAARLGGELEGLQARPWWHGLPGRAFAAEGPPRRQ
jgi:hypothetical protein